MEKDQKYYSHVLVGNLDFDQDDGLLGTLTERELQILLFLSDGSTNGVISDKLLISEGTVKKHISNIMGKLDCRTRVSAVLFANKNRAKINTRIHKCKLLTK